MKNNKKASNETPATVILKDLVDREQLNCKLRNPVVPQVTTEPSALYQDAGGGYNANYVFPQD